MTKPNALQALIASRRAEKDWTYQDIADRGHMSKATVYKLATKELDGLPRKKTLESLAKGLGLPARVVREAAIKATRMTTYTDDMNEWEQIIVGHSRELTEEQRRHVMSLVEAMLDK